MTGRTEWDDKGAIGSAMNDTDELAAHFKSMNKCMMAPPSTARQSHTVISETPDAQTYVDMGPARND